MEGRRLLGLFFFFLSKLLILVGSLGNLPAGFMKLYVSIQQGTVLIGRYIVMIATCGI